MKWKHYNLRHIGQTRIKWRFAFFPQKLDDGYTVWLGTYYIHQKWWPYCVPTTEDVREVLAVEETFGAFREMNWVTVRRSS